MIPFQIIILKEHLPMGLLLGKALGFLKVGEVLMVCQDGDRVLGSGEVLPPFSKSVYDC